MRMGCVKEETKQPLEFEAKTTHASTAIIQLSPVRKEEAGSTNVSDASATAPTRLHGPCGR